jgi:hypothetical protein
VLIVRARGREADLPDLVRVRSQQRDYITQWLEQWSAERLQDGESLLAQA